MVTPIAQTLQDQFRNYLQGQQYGGTLAAGQTTPTGTTSFSQLNPWVQQQMMSDVGQRATDFQLFGTGVPFSDYLNGGTATGAVADRGGQSYRTRLRGLRSLLRAPEGGLRNLAAPTGSDEAAQAAAAGLGTRLRGEFGGVGQEDARMRAGLSGASIGLNPAFRSALHRGAQSGFDAYRANNPGTTFLDYAASIGLF